MSEMITDTPAEIPETPAWYKGSKPFGELTENQKEQWTSARVNKDLPWGWVKTVSLRNSDSYFKELNIFNAEEGIEVEVLQCWYYPLKTNAEANAFCKARQSAEGFSKHSPMDVDGENHGDYNLSSDEWDNHLLSVQDEGMVCESHRDWHTFDTWEEAVEYCNLRVKAEASDNNKDEEIFGVEFGEVVLVREQRETEGQMAGDAEAMLRGEHEFYAEQEQGGPQ